MPNIWNIIWFVNELMKIVCTEWHLMFVEKIRLGEQEGQYVKQTVWQQQICQPIYRQIPYSDHLHVCASSNKFN